MFGDAYLGFMRAAPIDALSESWHLGHMNFPTAWGQAPDGFVYLVAYPGEPPDNPSSNEPPSPLYRLVLAEPESPEP